MRFVCIFEAVYVCVCAGQSKTGSIVKAFETLLIYNFKVFLMSCAAFSVCGYGNRIMIMSLSCPCCTGYPSCPSKALIRSQCGTAFLRPDVPDWLTDIFTGSSDRVSAFGHEVWLSYSSIVLLQHQTALCQFALV